MNVNKLVYLITFFLFLSRAFVFSQEDYHLSAFIVNNNAIITGQGTESKGLDISFQFSPDTLNYKEHRFSVELRLKEHIIAIQTLDFTYTPNDSIRNLIDSLGIDSIGNIDTTIHFWIPYRAIAVEEGQHDIIVNIFANNNKVPLYQKSYQFKQSRIYDLFLNLQSATIIPDSNANPLGLKYSVPDPKWLVNIGVDEQLESNINRNSFQLESKFFNTTISNYDKVEVCIYNADRTANKILSCYTIKHGKDSCSNILRNLKIGDKVEDAQFRVQKMERYPASSNFQVTENFIYKNIKRINISFDYDLPFQFKDRSIDIQLLKEKDIELKNIMVIKNQRQQINNRIIGKYSCFIAYYNLQNAKQIRLILSEKDKIIRQHQTSNLIIEKTIDSLKISQKQGYVHKCISGILYTLDFYLPFVPKKSEFKLNFPTLDANAKGHIFYWNEGKTHRSFEESKGILPLTQNQKIYI